MAVHLFWPGCLSDFKHCFFMTYMIHDMVETSQWICPWRKRFVLLGNLWEWFMYIQNDWIYIVNILFSIVSVSYAFKFRSFAFIYIYRLQIYYLKVIIQNLLLFFLSLAVWNFSLQTFSESMHHRPAADIIGESSLHLQTKSWWKSGLGPQGGVRLFSRDFDPWRKIDEHRYFFSGCLYRD